MLTFLAKRRHNSIDALGYCVVTLLIHHQQWAAFFCVLFAGALFSAWAEQRAAQRREVG